MNFGRHLSALALGIVFAGFAGSAMAQPVVGQPASALVFPYFDSSRSHGTFISVTNTNTSRLSCDLIEREGDVEIHYVYFNFQPGTDPNDDQCAEFDASHNLTPGDTLTVVADQDNPEGFRGWLWVEARDPESHQAIEFDYLIGSAIVVDTGTDFLFHYLPYGFRSLVDDSGAEEDSCGRSFTDVNADGEADFDGTEYDFWPSILYLDQFFGNPSGSPLTFVDTITLASCDVDFFDDDHGSIVHVLRWNNREQQTSAVINFECWFNGPLTDISQAFGDPHGDPNELVLGNRHLQTGWASFDSENDAIVGVIHQRISGTLFAAGHQLQFAGQFGGDPDFSRFAGFPDHLPCFLVRDDVLPPSP